MSVPGSGQPRDAVPPQGEHAFAARIRSTAPLPAPLSDVGRKRFQSPGMLGRAKRWLLGSPAAREWRIARRLFLQGVRVPEPLAYADAAGEQGEDHYDFRWLADHVDLQRLVLTGRLDARQRRRVARSLGQSVRAMHQAGVVHRDLHAGNVLVGPDQDVTLTDFHRGRTWRWPGAWRRDLCHLGRFFLHRSRATERLRFLRSYGGACWPADRATRHAGHRRLAVAARRSLLRFLRHHERRCLGHGREYHVVSAWQLSGFADARHSQPWQGTDADLGSWLEARGSLLHAGGRGRVYRVEVADSPYVFKVFEEPDARGWLKRVLRGSLARRAWLNLHRLRMAGVLTPEPRAFLDEAAGSSRRRSLLIMSHQPGVHLRDFLRTGRDLPAWVLDELARQIAAAHDHGLRNRDLKAENLLVDGERGTVAWLDPDGVRASGRPVDSATAARDLMRLNASFPGGAPIRRTQRLRFLRRYHRQRCTPVADLRTLWRDIQSLTQAKWNRSPTPLR